jgi:hypothetical protein
MGFKVILITVQLAKPIGIVIVTARRYQQGTGRAAVECQRLQCAGEVVLDPGKEIGLGYIVPGRFNEEFADTRPILPVTGPFRR